MRGAGKKEWRGGGRTEGGYERQHQSSSFPPPTWIYLTTYLPAIPCPLSPAQPVGVAPEFVSLGLVSWYLGRLGGEGGMGFWAWSWEGGLVDITTTFPTKVLSLSPACHACVNACLRARNYQAMRPDQTFERGRLRIAIGPAFLVCRFRWRLGLPT